MNKHTCLLAHPEDSAVRCTRPRGHQGQHVAHGPDGVAVLAVWDAADPEGLDGVLDALITAQRDTSRAIERRDRLVRVAREKDATWTVLGTILGITAQGAQKRYGTSQERVDAYEARQAARKARKAPSGAPDASGTPDAPARPDSVDPWPDGTVQGTI